MLLCLLLLPSPRNQEKQTRFSRFRTPNQSFSRWRSHPWTRLHLTSNDDRFTPFPERFQPQAESLFASKISLNYNEFPKNIQISRIRITHCYSKDESVEFFMRILFYTTPIVFPVAASPAKNYIKQKHLRDYPFPTLRNDVIHE